MNYMPPVNVDRRSVR